MRDWLQHNLNPLHVYCRLMDLHVGQQRAWLIASRWERLYEWIFPGRQP
jgi:hypothetical protein